LLSVATAQGARAAAARWLSESVLRFAFCVLRLRLRSCVLLLRRCAACAHAHGTMRAAPAAQRQRLCRCAAARRGARARNERCLGHEAPAAPRRAALRRRTRADCPLVTCLTLYACACRSIARSS
jgi:hypothetical protein